MLRRFWIIFFIVLSVIAVGLSSPAGAAPKKKQASPPSAKPLTVVEDAILGAKFVLIPPGKFTMGAPASDRQTPSEILRQVTISKPFYMQTTELTQRQWKQIMGNNPTSYPKCGEDCPVDSISWDEIQPFIKKLNEMAGADLYRLPTEAEWEYAARSGGSPRYQKYDFGNDDGKVGDYGWHNENSGDKPHPVAQKKPNRWGLYDIYGNVQEYVQDSFSYYSAQPATDPFVAKYHFGKVVRGGYWAASPDYNRLAKRDNREGSYGSIGFRLAMNYQAAGKALAAATSGAKPQIKAADGTAAVATGKSGGDGEPRPGRSPEEVLKAFFTKTARFEIEGYQDLFCTPVGGDQARELTKKRERTIASGGSDREATERFFQGVRYDFTSTNFMRVTEERERVQIKVQGSSTIIFPDNDTRSHRFDETDQYTLVKEKGSWRICPTR